MSTTTKLIGKFSRYDNFRTPAAWKLIELDKRYKFLKPGTKVVEAGAAPGSWTQVICDKLGLPDNKDSLCISIDRKPFLPVDGAICLGKTDITSLFNQAKILTWLEGRKVDCFLSDLAPNVTGQKYLNHTQSLQLIERVLPFTYQVLKPRTGLFLFKIHDGEDTKKLVEKLEKNFSKISVTKPDPSRGDSTESFVICRLFRGKLGHQDV